MLKNYGSARVYLEVVEVESALVTISVMFNPLGYNADFPESDKTLYFNVGIFSANGFAQYAGFNSFDEVKEYLKDMKLI